MLRFLATYVSHAALQRPVRQGPRQHSWPVAPDASAPQPLRRPSKGSAPYTRSALGHILIRPCVLVGGYNMHRAALLTLACAACLISLSQARIMPGAMAPSAAPEGNATCPPPGLAPVEEFDVEEYISESW